MLRQFSKLNITKNKSLYSAISQGIVKYQRQQPNAKEVKDAFNLCEFASNGDIKALEASKKSGTNIDSCDYDFRTALHLASAVGNLDTVKWLIENGAKVAVDRFGGLPLHDALRNNHIDIVNYLQEQPVQTDFTFDQSKNEEQMNIVFQLIVKEGIFSFSIIANEVDYFYNKLGLDNYYFQYFTPPQISKHIHSLIAAKKVAEIGRQKEKIYVYHKENDKYFQLCTSQESETAINNAEDWIRSVSSNESISLMYIRSDAPALPGCQDKLEIIVAKKTNYENPELFESDDVYQTSSADFLKARNTAKMQIYQRIISETLRQPAPAMKMFIEADKERQETCMQFGIKVGRGENVQHTSFFKDLKQIYNYLKIDIHKGVAETFSNGVVVYSYYSHDKIDEKMFEEVKNYANLMLILPKGKAAKQLNDIMYAGDLTGRQTMYAYCAGRFTYYFIIQIIEEFEDLYKHLDNDPYYQQKLIHIKQRFASETLTLEKIFAAVARNIHFVKALYTDFNVTVTGEVRTNTVYKEIPKLLEEISHEQGDKEIFETFYRFNQSISKTNFFKNDKCAIGFRLDPKVFLKDFKLPEIPFAIFMVSGFDFQGFHIRFRDISRGGIRLIKSRDEDYNHNRMTQFQENYGLAFTQKLKNKDIPESGSKGTILLRKGRNHMEQTSFMQYIDTMTDLMLVKEGVSDLYRKPEYLFFGPDENTADKMDKACLFMKTKGYEQWKSITTGKSIKLGGIPHDVYGMTTRSVRSYVKGIQEKLKLKQSECTKFITGGPDGDLGSNEILMGEEKVVGIVDGSGVLIDPNGLDRNGLLFLVQNRLTVSNFKGTLSPQGYLVKVNDTNIQLPDGRVIESGIVFRNSAHLDPSIQADFFVPCGGRPEAINMQNVDKLFNKDGSPRFPYIVEGANLFITEPARVVLEDSGVILFKDASTNKGGVTSSSLEVLACLAMDDKVFAQNMTGEEVSTMPDFYKRYVEEICERVENNARMEFEFIWNERKKSGKRSIDLTNEVSQNINNLFDVIHASDCWDNETIRNNVLKEMMPKTLVELLTYEKIVERVPQSYLKAMFAKYLAAHYYYVTGTDSNLYYFYEFMKQYN